MAAVIVNWVLLRSHKYVTQIGLHAVKSGCLIRRLTVYSLGRGSALWRPSQVATAVVENPIPVMRILSLP
jgi:hypothetical protein